MESDPNKELAKKKHYDLKRRKRDRETKEDQASKLERLTLLGEQGYRDTRFRKSSRCTKCKRLRTPYETSDLSLMNKDETSHYRISTEKMVIKWTAICIKCTNEQNYMYLHDKDRFHHTIVKTLRRHIPGTAAQLSDIPSTICTQT